MPWIRITLISAGFCLLLALPWLEAELQAEKWYGLKRHISVPALPLHFDHPHGLHIVLFGYLSCTQACPPQLIKMHQLAQKSQDLPVYFTFISLDPERDTQDLLAEGIPSLGERFYFIRPESTQAAQNLALAYTEIATKVYQGKDYEFNHKASLFVVSSQAKIELIYPYTDLNLDRVLQDIRLLLNSLES